jgi:glycosyltransferase involved in cell wall biosynthesis
VGRISEQKDYSTLIKAVQLVSKTIPVHLTIVGGVFCNNEAEKLKKLISDLKIENCITFAGFCNDVHSYYSSANIFVLSSAWEGFGNVIVEAMAFGLPVISTDCNYGPAEILENGRYGRLVPVSNSTEMAKEIIIESQSPLIDKSQLIMRSTDFSESKIASQYLNTIKRTLNEKI